MTTEEFIKELKVIAPKATVDINDQHIFIWEEGLLVYDKRYPIHVPAKRRFHWDIRRAFKWAVIYFE